MTNPLVSFIIPYYNAGETIQETIDSIFKQSYGNFDIWIINDGSTDPFSIEKLKDFEGNEKIHLLHQENAGPSVARNAAIKQSTADFIVPLDADDVINPDSIARSIEVLRDAEVGVAFGDIRYFGMENHVKIQSHFSMDRQLFMNQLAVTALIRKAVYHEVGYYDEFLSKLGLEDWEFWLRVGQSPWKFHKVEGIFFQARSSKNSRTFEVANQNLEQIKQYVYQKHAVIMAECYEKMYYQKKQLLETPDYRIGNWLMKPYRSVKKLFQ